MPLKYSHFLCIAALPHMCFSLTAQFFDTQEAHCILWDLFLDKLSLMWIEDLRKKKSVHNLGIAMVSLL